MDTLARDFGIVVVLLVALVVWNVYRATRARERRRRAAEAAATTAPTAAPETADDSHGPGAAGAGPAGTAPPGGQMVQEYVQQTVRHLRRLEVEQLAHGDGAHPVTPGFENVYTGLSENHVCTSATRASAAVPTPPCARCPSRTRCRRCGSARGTARRRCRCC